MNFDQVYKNCKKCSKCSLRNTATQVVPGEGDKNADIMFIGEGPGKNEDIKGVPFCGAAGKLLDTLLASIDLKRENVFITNMVRCRPPNNRDPRDDEMKACKEWTNKFIKVVNPKVFVLLGRFAMAKFFPQFKISKVHGNAYQKWGKTFVIQYHPAVALYNSSYKDTLKEDMQILREILEGNDDMIEILEDSVSKINSIMNKNNAKKKKKDSQLKIDL